MVAIPTLNGRNCNLFAQNLSSTGAREARFLSFFEFSARARSIGAFGVNSDPLPSRSLNVLSSEKK